jgi:hypothetical protein
MIARCASAAASPAIAAADRARLPILASLKDLTKN